MTAITSPCVNVCRMQGSLCVGCYRTLDEIAGWSQMGDAEKQRVLCAAAQRAGTGGAAVAGQNAASQKK